MGVTLEYEYRPQKGGDWSFRVLAKSPTSVGLTSKMYNWCKTTFEDGTWYSLSRSYHFKNKDDALLFLLRWQNESNNR